MSINALSALNSIIAKESSRREILHGIESNIWAILQGKPISMNQLLNYFTWLREGMVLVYDLLGAGVIASHIEFAMNPPMGVVPHFVGYVFERDALVIGVASIVQDAWVTSSDELVEHQNVGLAGRISARSNVMLLAAEESFHRYEIMALGLPHFGGSFGQNEHPREVSWRKWRDEELIRKGRINCRPAHVV